MDKQTMTDLWVMEGIFKLTFIIEGVTEKVSRFIIPLNLQHNLQQKPEFNEPLNFIVQVHTRHERDNAF